MASSALPSASQLTYAALPVCPGDVRVYNDECLVSSHTLPSPVWGMRFGRYGREDHSLITITKAGALEIKVGDQEGQSSECFQSGVLQQVLSVIADFAGRQQLAQCLHNGMPGSVLQTASCTSLGVRQARLAPTTC